MCEHAPTLLKTECWQARLEQQRLCTLLCSMIRDVGTSYYFVWSGVEDMANYGLPPNDSLSHLNTSTMICTIILWPWDRIHEAENWVFVRNILDEVGFVNPASAGDPARDSSSLRPFFLQLGR